jgi:hypothetical protein
MKNKNRRRRTRHRHQTPERRAMRVVTPKRLFANPCRIIDLDPTWSIARTIEFWQAHP